MAGPSFCSLVSCKGSFSSTHCGLPTDKATACTLLSRRFEADQPDVLRHSHRRSKRQSITIAVDEIEHLGPGERVDGYR